MPFTGSMNLLVDRQIKTCAKKKGGQIYTSFVAHKQTVVLSDNSCGTNLQQVQI